MVGPRQISEAELERLKREKPCDEVAAQWVRLRKHGKKMIGPCPICSDERQSATATRFECDAEGWVCAVCSDGGDVIKLVQLVEHLDFLPAVERLGGVRAANPEADAAAEEERKRRREQRERDSAFYRERERNKAYWRFWRGGTPITGTSAETYLTLRGVAAPAGAKLRCVEHMPYWLTGGPDPVVIHTGPALLAPIMRDGKFAAVHITYIDLGQPKGKAVLQDPDSGEQLDAKKVRGSKNGGHIVLLERDAPRRMVVGEGIEKTLAMWFALAELGRDLSDTAFWTSVDLGNLGGKAAETVPHPTLRNKGNNAPQRVPGPDPDLEAPAIEVPDSVEEIVILGDATSDDFLTRCAIARAAARWARPTRAITVAWCWADADFDDVLRLSPRDEACRRIADAFDAAAPVERPAVEVQQEKKPKSRRQARPHVASAAADAAGSNPHSSSAFAAAAPTIPKEEKNSETLTTKAGGSDGAPPDDEPITAEQFESCAKFDHSDTDNGKRLRCYFGRDLTVLRHDGVAGGAFFAWSGTHWDIEGGAALARLLAQQVGDLIKREADHMQPTRAEHKAIDTAAAAKDELDAADLSVTLSSEQGAHVARLEEIVKAGKSARSALSSRRTNHRKFGVQTKNGGKIEKMLDAAAPHMRQAPDSFNPDPMAVATLTHTLRFVQRPDPECPDPDVVRLQWVCEATRGHRREDLITSVVPCAYDRDADCPKWRGNMERFQPSSDKRRTVQQFTGRGLIAKPIQKVMFHYGHGGNFKSVFLETVTRVLGDGIAVGLPHESITGYAESNPGQARPDLVRVFGKRFIRVLELPDGVQLKQEMIKKLTGGEKWAARDLHKGYFEFVPCATPHMSGNGFPTFDGSDGGMARRLIAVHWTETILESEQREFDDVLKELMTEAPGILNWLIDGLLDYLNSGLFLAEDIREFTKSYIHDMDPVGQFTDAHVLAAPGEHVQARNMYQAYCAWCAANSKKPVSEAKFGRIMRKKFKRDDTGAKHLYVDVRLHDVPELPRDDARAPPISDEMQF